MESVSNFPVSVWGALQSRTYRFPGSHDVAEYQDQEQNKPELGKPGIVLFAHPSSGYERANFLSKPIPHRPIPNSAMETGSGTEEPTISAPSSTGAG